MPSSNWFKGNIHTHTTESDGDADPDFVTRWYRDHGYDFLVLSDHNHRTILEHEIEDGPLMIPGEEVSSRILGGSVPIHLNAIGIRHVVEPTNLDDIVATLQANVNSIINAGGIAQLNHPNYEWAFNHEHITQVEGASLMEIHNAHPAVNGYGAPGKPGVEEMWDLVLSAGTIIFGTATDDSHNYHDYTPDASNPGRGWVVVNAPELTVDAIVEGLATGQLLLLQRRNAFQPNHHTRIHRTRNRARPLDDLRDHFLRTRRQNPLRSRRTHRHLPDQRR